MTGSGVRAIRREAAVTLAELSERARLDVALLSRYETGKRPLSPERAEELVAVIREIEHDRQVAAARRAVEGAKVSLGAALDALGRLDSASGNAA